MRSLKAFLRRRRERIRDRVFSDPPKGANALLASSVDWDVWLCLVVAFVCAIVIAGSGELIALVLFGPPALLFGLYAAFAMIVGVQAFADWKDGRPQ